MSDMPPLYARGPYRVVAPPDGAPGPLFVVFDTAGAWLRDETTFDAARDWVDRRIALDPPAAIDAPTRRRR